MAKYTQDTDGALNTLVQAVPTTYYKNMHSTLHGNEAFKEIVLESVKRVLQDSEDAKITVGTGTGLTVDKTGDFTRKIYKVTLDYTGLSAAATNAEHTICTLPAKCQFIGIMADTTTKYTGGAVNAATIAVGIAGGNVDEYIEEHDVFAAAVVSGLVNNDVGEKLKSSATVPVLGGIMDWTTVVPIVVALVTTTADTDALTQGSTTYYIVTEQY
ncbi:MAG: hypothetical protein QQN63_06595 [Nitrosopumilus sp.]